MNSTEVMSEIGDAYLCLNIPDINDLDCQRDVVRILRVESLTESHTVNDLSCCPKCLPFREVK